MKIGIVQAKPAAGDIPANIDRHRTLIDLATADGADVVIFPELSLTGYEPALAKALAVDPCDSRFDVFQELADMRRITIAAGAPLATAAGIRIGMIIFRPDQSRWTYSKQYLHPDEEPYFIPGPQESNLLDGGIAPAICYEISVPEHAARAARNGAAFYVASVAKFESGIEKACTRLAAIARRYSMPVLMANCIGISDGAQCAGRTSVWNDDGSLLAQLNGQDEGSIVYDTIAKLAVSRYP